MITYLREFIVDGKYGNKATNGENPQFYRFDKPEDDTFPKMIELFCRRLLFRGKLATKEPMV